MYDTMKDNKEVQFIYKYFPHHLSAAVFYTLQ